MKYLFGFFDNFLLFLLMLLPNQHLNRFLQGLLLLQVETHIRMRDQERYRFLLIQDF